MISKLRFPFSLLIITLFGSCSPSIQEQPGPCPAIFFPGVIVTISDSVTGTPLAEQAQGMVRDGEYVDSLRPFSWTKDMVMTSRGAAGGRPGTYEVTVVHPGYVPWTMRGVAVRRGACHVGPVEVPARLQKLP